MHNFSSIVGLLPGIPVPIVPEPLVVATVVFGVAAEPEPGAADIFGTRVSVDIVAASSADVVVPQATVDIAFA